MSLILREHNATVLAYETLPMSWYDAASFTIWIIAFLFAVTSAIFFVLHIPMNSRGFMSMK
jgi:hypothetical protein